MTGETLLIVEDEMIVVLDLQIRLQRLGYDVPATAISGEEAIELAEKVRPNLILMDIGLKGNMDGIEAAELIRARFGIPVVFLTAYGDANTKLRVEATEPATFLIKPFEDTELLLAIETGLQAKR